MDGDIPTLLLMSHQNVYLIVNIQQDTKLTNMELISHFLMHFQ
jgi:hypothetical protein